MLPRYKNTWDVNIVLKELETWIPTEKLTLKELIYKLRMLIALLSGQRCLTIQALQITPDAMQLTDSKCTCEQLAKALSERNTSSPDRTVQL